MDDGNPHGCVDSSMQMLGKPNKSDTLKRADSRRHGSMRGRTKAVLKPYRPKRVVATATWSNVPVSVNASDRASEPLRASQEGHAMISPDSPIVCFVPTLTYWTLTIGAGVGTRCPRHDTNAPQIECSAECGSVGTRYGSS